MIIYAIHLEVILDNFAIFHGKGFNPNTKELYIFIKKLFIHPSSMRFSVQLLNIVKSFSKYKHNMVPD